MSLIGYLAFSILNSDTINSDTLEKFGLERINLCSWHLGVIFEERALGAKIRAPPGA
jgi:hypothetical protein